ncbi:hypothetical protein HNQ59_002717 [Chitinivorax tropicus]|uniref:Uncharacterized protein n=1 Tax=Chitinivorax tropicus TaxID=714531 RepID=A0A840MSN3_9PROT|nr:hypothetical protein [Chitinivorax tropicus]
MVALYWHCINLPRFMLLDHEHLSPWLPLPVSDNNRKSPKAQPKTTEPAAYKPSSPKTIQTP